jgi:hypothetical protein
MAKIDQKVLVTRRLGGQTQTAVLPRSPASHWLASAATVMARRTAPPVARACSFARASDGNFRTHLPIPHSGCRASAHGKACHSDSLNGVLSVPRRRDAVERGGPRHTPGRPLSG